MNQFFSNKKLIIILVSVIFFLAIFSLSLNRSGSAPFVQRISNDVVAISGRVFSKPANAVNNLFETVDQIQDTYTENQRLKREIEQLYETQAELSVLKNENEQLREEINIQETLTDYQKITGTVISRNPDGWLEQIVINQGSQSQIKEGMAVLSGNGMIGRITEVSPTSSKVQLLSTLDQRNNQVSAEVISAEGKVVHGVVNAYDQPTNRLIMEQITTEVKIEIGEQVITSGLGGKTPRGLVVGTVKEISLDSFGLSQKVFIEPASDYNDIRYVTIVNRNIESGEE
ncbi:rod shape-determining protein MreC [Lacticigenium naphthae]|uniref:rod shape-determining protein MreC n=1 Tax=Lacticigenium naphthae TaxID=515351 RepID=UPI00041D74EC|nr:rod shape-determining protein MreC [Lacticigenium naphthae]